MVNEVAEVQTREEIIESIWNGVLRFVTVLVGSHKRYEFLTFREGLDPTLEDMLANAALVDLILQGLYLSGELNHDEMRMTLNARQAILNMRGLGDALESENEEEFERIMKCLNEQAPF